MKQTKRAALLLSFMAVCALSVQADDYDDYTKTCAEWFGFNLRFDKSAVEFTKVPEGTEEFFQHFFQHTIMVSTFEETHGNMPTFFAGPIVTIDPKCTLLMEQYMEAFKPRPSHMPPLTDATIPNYQPRLQGSMLCNSALPWFHIDHEPSVQNDAAMMQRINEAINQNVTKHQDDELTRSTNADLVFTVKMPFFDKIHCDDEKLQHRLKDGATECYGVEIYRADRYRSITFLLFMKPEAKSIDEYLKQICQQVKFDPDFKYEE